MTRNWRIPLVVAALLILGLVNLVASGDLPWLNAKEGADELPAECDPVCDHPEERVNVQIENLGPTDAPIVIKAYYEWATADGEKTFPMLKRFAERYSPNLRVETFDTSTQHGRMQRAAAGLREGGLTVNGRNEFSRIVSGELKTIHFLQAPYPCGSVWREVDLHSFIKKELERLDLDTSVSDEAISETGGGQSFKVGDPNSPVKVVAYYPMPEDCVDQTFIVLKQVAEAYKDRVHFEFIDTCSDDGFVEWCDAHTVCHGIIINGKQKCTVTVDGEEQEVTFYAPLDTQWTRRQLEAALDNELGATGGDAIAHGE